MESLSFTGAVSGALAFTGDGSASQIVATGQVAAQGLPGAPSSLSIGTVTTLPAGSQASATITGSAPSQTLNLSIPQGTSGTGGSVTNVSVVSANGISGTVANSSTTPAITLSLGQISPSSVAASGAVSGSNLSGTNTGDETASTIKAKLSITTLSGSNTGDQDLSGLVPKTTTINSKALSANITLTNTDVGAAATSHTHAESDITGLSADIAATEKTANKNAANGYAGLDSNGKVTTAQLPASILGALIYQGIYDASTGVYPASPSKGWYYVVSTAGTISTISYKSGDWMTYDGTSWDKIDNSQTVSSVAGKTGAVTLAEADITNLTADLAAKQATITTTGILKGNGSGTIATAVAADFPVLNQNTTGTAGGLSANIAESQVTNLTTDLAARVRGTMKLTASTTAPSSPATGDLWVDMN